MIRSDRNCRCCGFTLFAFLPCKKPNGAIIPGCSVDTLNGDQRNHHPSLFRRIFSMSPPAAFHASGKNRLTGRRGSPAHGPHSVRSGPFPVIVPGMVAVFRFFGTGVRLRPAGTASPVCFFLTVAARPERLALRFRHLSLPLSRIGLTVRQHVALPASPAGQDRQGREPRTKARSGPNGSHMAQ